MRRLPGIRPVLSGVGLWLSFPDPALFPLAWFALVPYIDFLLEPGSWRRLLAGHFALSLLYFGGVLYWIPRVLVVYGNLHLVAAVLVYLLMILGMGCLLLPFSLLVQWAARRSPSRALWLVPGLWVLTEVLRNFAVLNGFPWASMGYSQFPYTALLQTVDIFGIYGLSLLILWGNAAMVGLIRQRTRTLAVTFALVFSGFNVYGAYRLYAWAPQESGEIRVGLIQPNIALSESSSYYVQKYLKDLPEFFDRAVEEGASWVIFPEAQNPYFYDHNAEFRSLWQKRSRKSGAYLLMNSTSIQEGEPREFFNSAYLIDSEGETAYRYNKMHLVPFGEYVPLENVLSFATPLVAEVSDFTPGSNFALGEVKDLPFATLICYESIFPELSRHFVHQGAQLLVNITNDAWFGDTAAPLQHLQMAAVRAVENRRTLLRVANSGYTALITPRGEILHRTELFEEAVVTAKAPAYRYRSLFSYLGSWPVIAIIIVSLSLVPAGRQRRDAERSR